MIRPNPLNFDGIDFLVAQVIHRERLPRKDSDPLWHTNYRDHVVLESWARGDSPDKWVCTVGEALDRLLEKAVQI